MILSRKHGFIFIKGRKVGGTSVEIALSQLCAPADIVTPITPLDERSRVASGGGARNYSSDAAGEARYLFDVQRTPVAGLIRIRPPTETYFNHMPLTRVLDLYGEGAHRLRVICVERCPYAKVISWANWRLALRQYATGGKMLADSTALREYLDQAISDRSIAAVRNIDLYRDHKRRLPGDIWRFEQLGSELRSFASSLGVAQPPSLPHAKKGVEAGRFDPAEFFSPRQRQIINEVFEDEFEAFGYPRR